MKLDALKILKTVSRCSFYILSRAAGFFLFAVLLNIIFLVILAPEMGAVLKGVPGMPIAGAGPAGAVIALVTLMIACWPVTLMILGFGIGFPAVYLVLGKKHGVTKAVHYVINDNRDFVTDYMIDRLFDYAAEKGTAGGMKKAVTGSRILEVLPRFIAGLENLPWPMRLLAGKLMDRIDFGGILTDVVEELGAGSGELEMETVSGAAKRTVNRIIEENVFVPDLKWFYILFAVNITAFLVVKIAV
ncbi:MAG: hypothetical protein MUD12_11380 [Spirochaetes bacterium]|jgi:hypothetical protein|nr:hypothetical protein [Spirochaetota bacterium]